MLAEENVADYPRPPSCERVAQRVRVVFGGLEIVDSSSAWRVCETHHAPAYYVPRADIADGVLEAVAGSSYCEWKGVASYFDVVVGGQRAERAAWSYPDPTPGFADITDHVAFYARSMDRCFVGDEQVDPMDGDFYGGWITSNLRGPIKGAPGTRHW